MITAMKNLKDQSQLAVKDMNWFETKRLNQWRKAEIKRLKKKRTTASNTMSEKEDFKKMAEHVLSTISIMD